MPQFVANVRIRVDERSLTSARDGFRSLADLYAALRLVATGEPPSLPRRFAFILSGQDDGQDFVGRIDLSRDEHGLLAYVVELRTDERDATLRSLVELAEFGRSRLALATVQHRLEATYARAAALTRRLILKEARSRSPATPPPGSDEAAEED